MPKIADEFNALTTISWVIVSFMLTQTALTPLWGRFCDLFGRRNCVIFCVGTFTIFSMACALSDSIVQLIVFRALQGIGGGGIMSVILILLADMTPPSSRAAYMAPIGSMFALSAVCGPLLGGFLTDGPGWRFAFWINVPIGGVCMIIQWFYIPPTLGQEHTAGYKKKQALRKAREEAEKAAKEGTGVTAPTSPIATDASSGNLLASATASAATGKKAPAPWIRLLGCRTRAEIAALYAKPDTQAAATSSTTPTAKPEEHDDETIDYGGIVTIVTAVICLCLALTWGGAEYAWGSWRIITLLVVGGVLFIAFCVIESILALHPIMPLRLFRTRNFSVGAAVSFFSGMSMTGGYVYLPIFFQLVMEKSASQSGVSMIPMMIGLPFGAILTGILVTKTGSYRPFPILGAIGTIVANYLYTTMDQHTNVANQVGFLILGGMALGPLVQVPLLAAQNAVSVKDMAVASSTVTFAQAIGGLLAVAIMQTIMNNRLIDAFVPVIAKIMALLPPGTPMPAGSAGDVAMIKTYFPSVWPDVLGAYATGISGTFWVGVGCACVALLSALCMEHLKLKDGLTDGMHIEGAPPPMLSEFEAAADQEIALEKRREEEAKAGEEEGTKKEQGQEGAATTSTAASAPAAAASEPVTAASEPVAAAVPAGQTVVIVAGAAPEAEAEAAAPVTAPAPVTV